MHSHKEREKKVCAANLLKSAQTHISNAHFPFPKLI